MPAIWKQSVLLNSASVKTAVSLNLTEWVDFSWAEELVFIIDVQQILGAPTAGTLNAKFQLRLPHKNGAIQYATQRLVDLTAGDRTAMLPAGDWPAPLADYTLGAPATYFRSVKSFGAGVNLNLYTTGLAGGSNPGFQTTVVLNAKGRA